MSIWYAICEALPIEMLRWDFMKNAFLAILLMAPLFGLLSTMIVTGRMSFFSDALGHSAFTGIAIGCICGVAAPTWVAVLFSVAFALLFAVNILMNFGNTGFDQAFNYYLKDQLGLTSSYNGIIKAAVGMISFVSNMTLCLWIIRKTDVRKSVAVMALFCTAASLGTVLIPQISLFILCSVLVYAGYSVSLPLLQHMAAEQADPAQKNLVMGFYNATKSLGSIIGSLTAGFLYGAHVKLPFLVVTLSYGAALAAAAACLVQNRRSRRND